MTREKNTRASGTGTAARITKCLHPPLAKPKPHSGRFDRIRLRHAFCIIKVALLALHSVLLWGAVSAGGLHPHTEGFSHSISHPDGSQHHSTFIRHNTDVVPRDHDSGVYDANSGHVVSVHSTGAHGPAYGSSHVVASRPYGAYASGAYLGGGGYLAGGYAPAAYATGGYLAGGYAPGAYATGGYLAGGYAAPAVSVAAAPAVSVAAAPAVSVAAPVGAAVFGQGASLVHGHTLGGFGYGGGLGLSYGRGVGYGLGYGATAVGLGGAYGVGLGAGYGVSTYGAGYGLGGALGGYGYGLPTSRTVVQRGPYIGNRILPTAFGDVHAPHHEFHHHEHHTVHPVGGTSFVAAAAPAVSTAVVQPAGQFLAAVGGGVHHKVVGPDGTILGSFKK
ncbi:hypothetical protein HPB48_017764 [Haemaphysalis longicornis]|uniref:Cuticle protein n=1 Tax=Haemaphysalis longicornis TaxID=44386 RepID=A0A9J6H1E4_HAELO|nr:hypothetical protein HPB48_017764 [Haemaphysalis longicornis]